MSDAQSIEGVLVQWGERLFYPGNRIVKVALQPKLPASLLRQRANLLRAAENLRGWEVEAEASTRVVRGQGRTCEPLWLIKARKEKRLQRNVGLPSSAPASGWSSAAKEPWSRLSAALNASSERHDRTLASAIERFNPEWFSKGLDRSSDAQCEEFRR